MSTVTWRTGYSADWTQSSGWSGGAAPSSSTTVAITGPGSYIVTLFGTGTAAAVTMSAASAELYDAGALTLGGSFALSAGTLDLAGGSLNGGTLALQGGHLQSYAGTLNAVSVQGVLTLNTPQSSLFVENGLTLSGANGSGAGSIALTGAYAMLDFIGSQTLNNDQLSIGAAGNQAGQTGAPSLNISQLSGATSGATLTLGPNSWIRDVGGQANIVTGPTSDVTQAGLPAEILNQGTITANVAGSTLSITGAGSFVNQGTIAVSNGATLDVAMSGFSNPGSLSLNQATLGLTGTFAVSQLSTLGIVHMVGGQVDILGTADDTGATLTLGTGSALTGQLGNLALAGTILNGVVLDTGGGLNFAPGSGILDGTTYEGTLALTGQGAGVTLTDGAEVTTATGGPGTIIDTGAGAALLLRGAETLTNTTISLGSSGAAAVIGTGDAWLASQATTATLGQGVTIVQKGANAALQANGWSLIPGFGSADTLVNQASVSGSIAGGHLALSGYGTLINQGSIGVSSGDTLAVTVQDFVNSGTLQAGIGGGIRLGASANVFGTAPAWSNTGQISLTGGTLSLGGNFITSQIGTVTATNGAQISLSGTLNNAGTTLTLGSQAAGSQPGTNQVNLPSLSLCGTIQGGTINDPLGLFAADTSGTALLDGVGYAGLLSLAQPGVFLRVRDGLSLSGTAMVTGAGAELDFQGSQTLSSGTIMLGNTSSAAEIAIGDDPTLSGSTLTIAHGVSIIQSGAQAIIGQAGGVAGDAIASAASITAAQAGGTLTLGGPDFINSGQISVSNGETLSLTAQQFSNLGNIAVSGGVLSVGGSLTLAQLGQLSLSNATIMVPGTLNLGGGTLAVGQGSPIGRLILSGTLTNGTISDAGGGLAVSGNAALNSVSYQGLLDLSRPLGTLSIGGGLTVLGKTGSNSGSIALTGPEAKLIASSSATLNAGQISLGSVTQTYNGQSLPAPELDAAAGATLTIGARTTVTEVGTDGIIGDAALGNWNDSIVNAGQIIAAVSGGTLALGSSFFTNAGSLAAASGAIVSIQDTGFSNTGTLSVGSGASLQVSLFDFFAAPNATSNIFSNTGLITMSGGTMLEINGNGLFPNVPLTNLATGTISGFGTLAAQISNYGTLESAGGTLLVLQPLLGGGKILIAPSSTLEMQAAVTAGQVIQFMQVASAGTGTSTGGTLRIDQPSSFAGTLSGLNSADTIDLSGQLLSNLTISNGTIIAASGAGTLHLAGTTPFSGALYATADGHGGTNITYTPQNAGSGSSAQAATMVQVAKPTMLFWAASAGDVFKAASANLTGAHITNWSTNDSLDITDMVSSKASLTVKAAAGVTTLTISDGTHNVSIGLTGTFNANQFHLAADGLGGTSLTYHS